MSQRWSRQQSEFSNIQLWQERLMYRQIQELQRQQQLQQLDQEARQQNSSNQFSGVAKQAAADQLPLVVNGVPIHDISNHTWKNEDMGSEPKVLSSPQMFAVGNMNWAQRRGTMSMQGFPNGLVFSQNKGQALGSLGLGLVQQQPDRSLYGTPVSSSRHILNQYSQFPVACNSSADMIDKSDENQVEKQLMQAGIVNSVQSEQCVLPGQVCLQDGLVSRQISPGKTLFGHVSAQNISNGVMLENVPQLNSLGRSTQVQEFLGRQEQNNWSNLQQKTVLQVGPSQGMSALDSTEQRLLFGTDDESPWVESSGRVHNIGSGGYMCQSFPEGNDHLNAFPSMQNGSWSALMQSAVAEASSSDTGLQDEWNGLTLQQKEPTGGIHPTMSVGSGKQQTTWVENFQSAYSSTSRPLPLSDGADMSRKDHPAAMFGQPYVRSAYDHCQRLDVEASTSSLLDQSQLHQKVLEGIVQSQMHSGSMTDGAKVEPYEQPLNSVPAVPKLSQHSLCGTWDKQQNMPLHNGSQNHSKVNAWNASELTSSGRQAILKADDHETTGQNSWINRPKGATHIQRYQDVNMWKDDVGHMSVSFSHPTGAFSAGSGTSGIGSPQVQTSDPYAGGFVDVNLDNSNQEVNEQSVSGHQADYRKIMSADSSVESRGNEDVDKHKLQVKKDQVAWGSSVNLFERASGVAYDKEKENSSQKEVSDGDHISDNSRSAQPSDSGRIRREESLLARSDSSQSGSSTKLPSCQIGRKNSGSLGFHLRPMENAEADVELPTSKHNFYSQGQSQMVMCGKKSQKEPELIGQLKFGGHSASHSRMDMDEGQLLDSQRDVNAPEEVDFRGRTSIYDSDISSLFKGSTEDVAQTKSGQTCQNMLELLHKVDQSRDRSNVSHSGFSNHNVVAKKPDKTASAMPSYLQHNQPSALQGIGLALPSKHQAILHHALSSQAVQHYNPRHLELEAEGEQKQTCAPSSLSVRTVPPLHQVSERENWDMKSNLCGLQNKETSLSNVQMFFPAISTSRLPYGRNQLQQQQQQLQQQISMTSGGDQVVDMHCGSELYPMPDEAVAGQSGEQLLPGVSQIPPFKLACSSDSCPPVVTHPYSRNAGQPQVIGTTSLLRSSSQLSVLEKQFVPQSSTSPVMPQQGGFSAMLQNVWTNLSVQQRLSGNCPANVRPNLFHPLSMGGLDTNSLAMQRPDDQGRQAASKFATCSINSEQFTYEEQDANKGSSLQQNPPQKVDIAPHMYSTPQVQESTTSHASDGNSSVSILPMVQLHQQDFGRLKLGQGSSLDKQTGHASLLNIASSSHHIRSLGDKFKSSDDQNQNYSLLQQLQAMKAVEAVPSSQYDKRLKEGDSIAYAEQMAEKMPPNFIYGFNRISNNPLDNELRATTGHQSSFPSDTKMLCFSLLSNENQSMVRASQLIGSDLCSQDLTGTGLDSPNYSSSVGKISIPPSIGVTQPKQIGPEMAPSWFEQYGKFKNGQTLAKAAVQHYLFSKASESIGVPSSMVQRNDSSQVMSFWHSSSTAMVNEQSSSLHKAPANDVGHNLVPRPKKRKTAPSGLIPWHKEITKGSDKLWNISMAELDWSQATKRLCEKVEDEDQMNGDGSSVPRARRRLILTSQLMQQLFPALPMRILTADVTLEYESVTYLVARLALGDACGRISCSRSDPHFPSVGRNMISENFKATKGVGEHFFSEVTEGFIGRMSKLENELSRSEKRASFLDIRVECDDLERFSIMNRFAKFHCRSQADGVGNSSTSEAAPRKMLLQRYVTTLPMPGNLPEGIICLSL